MSSDVELYLFNKRIYEQTVVPAYEAFLKKKDPKPLLNQLAAIVKRLDAGNRMYSPPFWNKKIYQEAVGIIDGSVYYNSEGGEPADSNEKTTRADLELYVRENLTDGLVMPLCIPYLHRAVPTQDMTNSELVGYLYERSKWIQEVFTFTRSLNGGILEVPIGESSDLFSKEELQRFSQEMSRIPKPSDPNLKREFENLQQLLKLASSDPDLTLVMAVV